MVGERKVCPSCSFFCRIARSVPSEPAILMTGSIDGPTCAYYTFSHEIPLFWDSGPAVCLFCLRVLSFQASDPIARAQQAANRAKIEAGRKVWHPYPFVCCALRTTVREVVKRLNRHNNSRFSTRKHTITSYSSAVSAVSLRLLRIRLFKFV